jgi:hypothetical protein
MANLEPITEGERELVGWMNELRAAAAADDAPYFVGGMSTREDRLRDRAED